MYQSIHYCREGDNKYHYFLRDDKKGIQKFQYWSNKYKLDPEGDHIDLFGRYCSVIKKFDWEDPEVLEKDIDKNLLVLRDFYYKSDDKPSFHNVIYLDIEIEILGALTPYTIKEANAEVTSLALIDTKTKIKYCFIVDKQQTLVDTIVDNKHIIVCDSEKSLFTKFLKIYKKIDPTIVVGWNSDFFDIPYLYYRGKKIIGDKILQLSPVEEISENIYNPNSPITIGLVNCLDFMLLFKKYIMKEESSYKLGDIGTKYVKLGKIEFNGNLDKLFKEDINKFIEYNIRDVEIIEALEDKLKFIELTVLICHLCHIPYESVYYNTILNEGAILTYLKRRNIVAPNKPTTTNKSIKELEVGDEVQHQRGTPTVEGTIMELLEFDQVLIKTKSNQTVQRNSKTIKRIDSYSGGYLLDPTPGLYSDVSDLDFTSLYPSIIKTLNLGIETLICKIKTDNNYEQYNSLENLQLLPPKTKIYIQRLNINTYAIEDGAISASGLINLIKKNNYTISASGAIYRTDIKSISCIVLEDWFIKREEYRTLKKSAGKNENWEDYKLYDLYQLAFKILQNALYGTYAINSWRFTDGHKIISSSITNSGQRLVKTSINGINDLIDEYLQLDKDTLKKIFNLS
jgi:DNA polymerase elongation subunit (family B)